MSQSFACAPSEKTPLYLSGACSHQYRSCTSVGATSMLTWHPRFVKSGWDVLGNGLVVCVPMHPGDSFAVTFREVAYEPLQPNLASGSRNYTKAFG